MSKQPALLLALAVTLASNGCATLGPTLGPTPAPSVSESPISDSEQTVRSEGSKIASVMLGGMVNSMLTYGLIWAAQCLPILLKGEPQHRGRSSREKDLRALCYIAGGAVIVGGLAEGYQARLKVRSTEQRRSQAELALADIEADNERSRQYIEASRRVVAERTKEIDRMRREVANRQLTQEEAEDMLGRDRKNIEQIEKTIKALNDSAQAYQESAMKLQANPKELDELRKKIRERERQKADLERALEDYSKAERSISKA